MKKIVNKIVSVKNSIVSLAIFCLCQLNLGYIFADNGFTKAANEASKGVHETGMSMVKPLIVIVGVVIGIIFIIGTQRQKDEAKEKIPMILVGVGIILGASLLATTIFDWFSK